MTQPHPYAAAVPTMTDSLAIDLDSLGLLAQAVAPVALPRQRRDALRGQLLSWVAKTPRVVDAQSGQWQALGKHYQVKILTIDRVRNEQTCFMQLAPGAKIPAHEHIGPEHCMVLTGSLETDDGLVVGPNQMLLAVPGEHHVDLTAPRGALIYLRSEITPALSALAAQRGL